MKQFQENLINLAIALGIVWSCLCIIGGCSINEADAFKAITGQSMVVLSE